MTLDDALKICGLIAAVFVLLVLFGSLAFTIWILWLASRAVKGAEKISATWDEVAKRLEQKTISHSDICQDPACMHPRNMHNIDRETLENGVNCDMCKCLKFHEHYGPVESNPAGPKKRKGFKDRLSDALQKQRDRAGPKDHRDVCTCDRQRGMHSDKGVSVFTGPPEMHCPGFELAKRFEP